jgi:hypothetical protein
MPLKPVLTANILDGMFSKRQHLLDIGALMVLQCTASLASRGQTIEVLTFQAQNRGIGR